MWKKTNEEEKNESEINNFHLRRWCLKEIKKARRNYNILWSCIQMFLKTIIIIIITGRAETFSHNLRSQNILCSQIWHLQKKKLFWNFFTFKLQFLKKDLKMRDNREKCSKIPRKRVNQKFCQLILTNFSKELQKNGVHQIFEYFNVIINNEQKYLVPNNSWSYIKKIPFTFFFLFTQGHFYLVMR